MSEKTLLEEVEELISLEAPKVEVTVEEPAGEPVADDVLLVDESFKYIQDPAELNRIFEWAFGVRNASEVVNSIYVKESEGVVNDIYANMHGYSPYVYINVYNGNREEANRFLSEAFGVGCDDYDGYVEDTEVVVENSGMGVSTWSDSVKTRDIAKLFFDNADIDIVQTPNGIITREQYESREDLPLLEAALSQERLIAIASSWRKNTVAPVMEDTRVTKLRNLIEFAQKKLDLLKQYHNA